MTFRFSHGSRARCAGAQGRHLSIATFALLALAPAPAFAHAHLVHAQPAVGSTVSTSPAGVTLEFSEGVVPRLSDITIRDAGGRLVASGRGTTADSPASLSVAIGKTLTPGTYTVTWHAVSVDTHRSQGHFSFTVAP